jgi:hypothetical protein
VNDQVQARKDPGKILSVTDKSNKRIKSSVFTFPSHRG